MSVNRVFLMGEIGGVIEVKGMENKSPYCRFILNTKEEWLDKSTGNLHEKVEKHNILIKGNTLCNTIKGGVKGDYLYLEGMLITTRFKDASGVQHYFSEIAAKNIEFTRKVKPRQNGIQQNKNNEQREPMNPIVEDIFFTDAEIPL